MDKKFYYLKNSSSQNQVIKIPVDRPTFYQRHICIQGAHDFNTTEADIKSKFRIHAKTSINWSIGIDDWFLDDEGYFLTLCRKK